MTENEEKLININDKRQSLDLEISKNSFSAVEKNKIDFNTFKKFIGPGWLIAIAYLDPGNLQGDLDVAVGAKFGLLWVLAFSTFVGFLY